MVLEDLLGRLTPWAMIIHLANMLQDLCRDDNADSVKNSPSIVFVNQMLNCSPSDLAIHTAAHESPKMLTAVRLISSSRSTESSATTAISAFGIPELLRIKKNRHQARRRNARYPNTGKQGRDHDRKLSRHAQLDAHHLSDK